MISQINFAGSSNYQIHGGFFCSSTFEGDFKFSDTWMFFWSDTFLGDFKLLATWSFFWSDTFWLVFKLSDTWKGRGNWDFHLLTSYIIDFTIIEHGFAD